MAEGTAETIPNRNAKHIRKRSRLQPPRAAARSFTNKVYQILIRERGRVKPTFHTLDVIDQTHAAGMGNAPQVDLQLGRPRRPGGHGTACAFRPGR